VYRPHTGVKEGPLLKPKLVVTNRYLPPVEERMEREFVVKRATSGRAPSSAELLVLADGADAMLITPMDQLGAAFFERISKSVKVISTYSVGLDHIDLKAAASRNISIGYTPGVNADATAEIAMLLMLGAARRAYEGQEMVRTQSWSSTSRPLLGWQLSGKSLGILGMGRIGQAVAKRSRAFGMRIHYTNPAELPQDIAGDSIYHRSLTEMLPFCDFLSLHAPETAETHHMIDAKALALLPHGAILINTARGGLVVDSDVIDALKSGQLAAAGLDVFEKEPVVNPDYLTLNNVFLLPHLGSATVETRTRMGMICLDNISAVLLGKPAPSLAGTQV
jgi:lactate dehydrogenase-like 2-hydroxyacid dehydrogenase